LEVLFSPKLGFEKVPLALARFFCGMWIEALRADCKKYLFPVLSFISAGLSIALGLLGTLQFILRSL